MEQRSFEEEEVETSQSATTPADGQIETEVTTSIQEVVSESDSADETVASVNTSGDEKAASESTPGDEKAASESTPGDEKVGSESTPGDEKDASETAPQEEEEEECGFCLFMKKGPCGESFKLWQDCIEEAEKSEKDIVRQCAQTTTLLKACMELNPQYYGPVLDAEKAMEADLASSAEEARTDAAAASSESTPGGEESATAGGEESATAGGEESAASGGEERAQTENGAQTVETSEVLTVVVDDEGQVVEEVDIVEVEISGAA